MPDHRLVKLVSAASILLLVACGSPAQPVMIAPGPPSLSLGIGDVSYQPLADGQSAQVIHGPQGGYHIVVSLLATGIWPGTTGLPSAPDNPTTTLRAFRASGAEFGLMTDNVNLLHSAYTLGSIATDAGAASGVVLINRYLRLDTMTPASFAGERLLLRAEVVDRDGRTLSDEKHVIAIPPNN